MKYLAFVLLVCLVGTLNANVFKMSQLGRLIFNQFEKEQQPQEKEPPQEENIGLPKFCNGLQCPQYKVLEKTKDYELREYVQTNWVSSNVKGIDWTIATYELFMRLFRYISGANMAKKKIAMTAPVITKIIPGQGPACENDYTVSFFLDPKAGVAPKATDKTVFQSKLPAQKVYVRSFGGYAMTDFEVWRKEAEDLAKAIGDASKYDADFYYTAGYDSPAKLTGRHNEIWFFAKK